MYTVVLLVDVYSGSSRCGSHMHGEMIFCLCYWVKQENKGMCQNITSLLTEWRISLGSYNNFGYWKGYFCFVLFIMSYFWEKNFNLLLAFSPLRLVYEWKTKQKTVSRQICRCLLVPVVQILYHNVQTTKWVGKTSSTCQ